MSQESLYICVDHQWESDALPCPRCDEQRVADIMHPKQDVFEHLKAGIVAELEARDQRGFEQHGRPLLTNEARFNAIQEAYEEVLDALVYLKMAMMEATPHEIRTLPGRCVR